MSSSDSGRTLWTEQNDPTDTGVEIDTDYIKPPSRRAEIGFDGSVTATTDGGEELDTKVGPSGAGSKSWSDCQKDETEKEYPNGFAEQSKARTTQLGDKDANGNMANFSWQRGGRQWRMQMGLNVALFGENGVEGRAVGATIKPTDRDRLALLDAWLQNLGLSGRHKERVKTLIQSDDKQNVWNRWHSGDIGAAVGYSGWLIFENEDEAQAWAAEQADGTTITPEDARQAVEYGFRRASERSLSRD